MRGTFDIISVSNTGTGTERSFCIQPVPLVTNFATANKSLYIFHLLKVASKETLYLHVKYQYVPVTD